MINAKVWLAIAVIVALGAIGRAQNPSGAYSSPAMGGYPLLAPSGSAVAPSYSFTSATGTGMFAGGGNLLFSVAGSQILTISSGGITVGSGLNVTTPSIVTSTNCSVNSVSPAACGAAAAGSFVVPTTTTAYTVNTTKVNAASRIFLFPQTDTRDLPGAPTCVTPAITAEPVVSGIVAATSFTITIAQTTGQTCWDYLIVN